MKQFLVIQLARFGDLVQTKRLIKSLEARGQVHLCIDDSLATLASLIYPKAIIHSLPVHNFANAENFERMHKCLLSMPTKDFCAVYNLNHAGINRALARFFEPEQVVGYVMHGAQALHSNWIRKAFAWTQNRAVSPINLVDFWAFFDELPCAAHEVNPRAVGQGKGIGVVLAGRESRRSLPPAVLAQVLRTYFELMNGADIYLLGTAHEAPLAKQLKRQMQGNMLSKVQDLSGKTSWSELIDTLQGLDVIISPDTGTMHLAAHLGVPVQAFFLSSAWCHETGPYGEGHGVWQSVYECAPCLESAPCPINTKCLEDFSNKEFLRALALNIQNKQGKFFAMDTIKMPTNMVYYTSSLDEFGSAWQLRIGEDENAKKRQNMRAVLAESRGYALANIPIINDAANMYYNEADWMLELCAKPSFHALMGEK